MIAYLNGEFLPLESCRVPVWDYGFTMGVAISEQIRTFGGQLPLLEYHLQRLARGLEITGIDPGQSLETLGLVVRQVVQRNADTIGNGLELSLGLTVTPGGQSHRAPANVALDSATTLVVALPLVKTWERERETGVKLVTVTTREIPNDCLPRELKCRSRLHYFLAEQEATLRLPGARALLQDVAGNIAEGTTHSLLMVRDGQVISPLVETVLPSVSVRVLQERLLPSLGVPFVRRSLTIDDLLGADELLWLSTPSCLLPVAELNSITIGDAKAKPFYRALRDAWTREIGEP